MTKRMDNNTASFNAVLWLKPELDKTISDARNALDFYIEDSEDLSSATKAAADFQQVHAVLQVANIKGGVFLLEELLNVLNGLIEGKIRRRHEALDAILRASVQLPDYLEYIQQGHDDVPIVLLPLLNDLRAVRDASLLSDRVLVVPMLDSDHSLYTSWKSSTEEPQVLAKSLRPILEKAILGVFINKDVYNNLLMAGAVFLRLGRASTNPSSKRLWWFGQAMAESLHARSLDLSIACKSLIGKLNRQLKVLELEGEEVFIDQIPVELVKNILFYIASSSSGNTTVDKIKTIYKLDEMIPAGSSVDSARANLKGSNVQIYESLGEAVLEDVEEIKERLEVYSFADNPDAEMLRVVIPKMKNLSETLSMLGQDKEMHDLKQQVISIEEAFKESEVLTRDEQQDIANVLINIEIGVKSFVDYQGIDEKASNNTLPGHEYNKVFHAVIQESLGDLGKVRGTFNDYLAHHKNPQVLEGQQHLVGHIHGALEMLSINEVLPLASQLAKFVGSIEDTNFQPEETDLNLFADGFVSLEFYLESLRPRLGGQNDILKKGMSSLEQIVLPEQQESNAEIELDSESRATDQEDSKQNEEAFEFDLETASGEPQSDASADNSELELLDDSDFDIDIKDDIAGEEQFVEEIPDIETIDESAITDEEEKDQISGLQVLPNDVDPEIYEIFLEEINEENESINKNLDQWMKDNTDDEALATLRRSFHTLKGSGRLVGAEVLGEFAWSVEDLTNRLIKGSVAPSVPVIATLESARGMLPSLIKGIEQRSAPDNKLSALISEIDTLISGDGRIDSSQTVTKKKASSDNSQSHENDSERDLKSIFIEEAEEHLEYLQSQIDKARDFGTRIAPDNSLINVIHALNVGAAAADLNVVALPYSVIERYLKTCQRHDLDLDDEFVHHLDRVKVFTQQSIIVDKDGETPKAIDAAEMQRITDLLSTVEAREQSDKNTQDSVDIEVIELSHADDSTDISIDEIADSLTTEIALDEPINETAEPQEPGEEHSSDVDTIPDNLDAELLEIFLEEAYEILDESESALSDWSDDINDVVQVKELQRHLHTLKGGARMAEIVPIGDLSHELESLFDAIVENKVSCDNSIISVVQNAFDQLVKMVDAVRDDGTLLSASNLEKQINTILNGDNVDVSSTDVDTDDAEFLQPEVTAGNEDAVEPEQDEISPSVTGLLEDIDKGRESTADKPSSEDKVNRKKSATPKIVIESKPAKVAAISNSVQPATSREQIRVNSDLLDDLVNHAGEVNVFHSRIDENLSHTSDRLQELQRTTRRLGEQLRRLETEAEAQILSTLNRKQTFDPDAEGVDSDGFDPLELDRYSKIQQYSKGLAESLGDLNSLEEMVTENLKEVVTLMRQKSRVSTDLQEGLMRTRLVPFSNQVPRLSRIVRQTASQLNKNVELVIRGENNEMDRKLLDSMSAPLEHLLRNAVSHGIELPEERLASGKKEKGIVEINIHRSGSEIQIEVSDDGAGINVEKVRDRAIEQNIIELETDLTEDEILQFILESGFSTADDISQISGRGVGMDVVNTEIKKLNGALRISSDLGKGTTFIINLPFTLAINQSLLIQAGEDLFAVPATHIYAVSRVSLETITNELVSDNPQIEYNGSQYQLRHLTSMLHRKETNLATAQEQLPVLLVNSGDHQVAFLVDEIYGNREIVVKPLGPPLSALPDYSGATILGDGKIAPILDMAGLIRTTAYGKLIQLSSNRVEEHIKPLIMVVDDSITIRKVTSRILERNNFDVVTAKDGMDAATQLQDVKPDVMLLDVEMPRMDGFELATQIRSGQQHKDLPIIIITSRTGEKHKKRAFEIGVNRYLGKPFQEDTLLNVINGLLEENTTVEARNVN